MARKKIQEDHAKSLQESFDSWQFIYENGCSDPFWTDGSNLNLVRNHISYYKSQIEETMKPDEYPEIYYRESPPEVDYKYIAKADEIREHATASLGRYLTDPDYQFLCRRVESLDPKDAKRICIHNIINYAAGLEDAIKNDDLVTMRRHRNSDTYLSSFASCAQKVRELKPPDNEQFSLFYSYNYGEPQLDDAELR